MKEDIAPRSLIAAAASLMAVKRRLVVAAAALALATPALAALPQVHARAYMVEDAATGQVLAEYRQRARPRSASPRSTFGPASG